MENVEKHLAVFEGRNIRRHWDSKEEKWYFSVVDVVAALTESTIPRRYWSDLKINLKDEGSQLYEKIVQLKMRSSDGKEYDTDCADTETMFRIIQSIPSPNAEPFKLWLARVGYERIQEIENPELTQEWMKVIYERKGYSKSWIDKRLRGVAIRQNLTDEWKERGVKRESDFAILTAEISQATFDMTPAEYKKYKGLQKKNQNLRDHMDELELIFTMLGEKVTTEISIKEKPVDMPENRKVANRGGRVAGNARKETEKEIGRPVSTSDNYLEGGDLKKRLKQ